MCEHADDCQGTCLKAQLFNFFPPDEPCKDTVVLPAEDGPRLMDVMGKPNNGLPEILRVIRIPSGGNKSAALA